MVKIEPDSIVNKDMAQSEAHTTDIEYGSFGVPHLNDVAQLSRELNGASNSADALQIALHNLARFINANMLHITTSTGEDRQQLRATLVRGSEVSLVTQGEIVRVSHTMFERAAQTGVPVRFNDAPSELVGGALINSLVCPAAQSILCAPLVLGAQLTGMIVASAPAPVHYSEQDADLTASVAHLLAATLARIELATQAEEVRQVEETREHNAALLEQLRSAARSTTDLDRIIQHTVDALARALPASFVILRRVSFGLPEPALRAWTPGNTDRPLEIHAPVARLERTVYTDQRSLSIEDLREERARHSDLRPLVERLGALSLHLLPVVYGGQVLASLGLIESDTQRRWTHEEQSLLARVAETVAPLIFNAQLHGRLRSYVEDLLTLLRLANNVQTESDLDKALRAVLDSWSKIAGAEAAAILRWDEEAQLLRLAASRHLPTGILERYTQGVPLSSPVAGLAAERRVGVVADLAGEARFADLYAAARWSGLRGAWATPIIGQAGKVLGVLVTFSAVVVEASIDDQRLADLFTRPAAIAFHNLELGHVARLDLQKVKQLEDSLRLSDQHKTEFMSIISHELRTPLNAIIGFAQMLIDGFSGDLNEQQRADVQTISTSANRLLSMVEDTLDLARIDAERFPIFMDSVAFDELVRRAVEVIREPAALKGIEITTEDTDDAPLVRTDPERVRQILNNLLSNALKFTDTGTIHVKVERVESGHVQISVTDTGIGFDIAAFPQIFDEFRQADNSNTRAHGGTGLGLAVSKRLVRRLGGDIGAISTPGQGSTFWFCLPPEIPGADT